MNAGTFNLLSLSFYVLLMVLFPILLWIVAKILGPTNPNPVKNSTFECGQVAAGEAHMRFNVTYYPYAIIYAIFGAFAIFLLILAPDILTSGAGLNFSFLILAVITSALFSAAASLRLTRRRW